MIAPEVHVFGGQIHTLHTLHKGRGFWRIENSYSLPLPLPSKNPGGLGYPCHSLGVSKDKVENSIANELLSKQRKLEIYHDSRVTCILCKKRKMSSGRFCDFPTS